MKFIIAAVASLLVSSFVGSLAHADGFLCETQTGLRLKVFNHVLPQQGTRVPAVMIISDTSSPGANKTIARFTQAAAELLLQDNSYLAKMDLSDSSKSEGSSLQGTRLENVSFVKLYVDFSYDKPVAHGAELTGTLTLMKSDSGLNVEPVICHRYLKQ